MARVERVLEGPVVLKRGLGELTRGAKQVMWGHDRAA